MGERLSITQLPELEMSRETEPPLNIPIIDIVRHGMTDYKEFTPGTTFDPHVPGFELDAEHLDLTEEGIRKINETAQRLISMIDKDNEVVVLVTSPQFRARSSILLIENALKERGITILNPSEATVAQEIEDEEAQPKGIHESPHGLGEIPLRKKREFGTKWRDAHRALAKARPEVAQMPPPEAHREVAASLGQELSDIMAMSHEEIGDGFRRFLRHTINIDRWLQDETRQQLEGKRLRVVCVTHEERLYAFVKNALGLQETVGKGDMLEIDPHGSLEAGGETTAKVTLFGKEQDRTSNIRFQFSPDSNHQ